MKHEFTLDENVWVLAAKGRDDRNRVDDTAARLIQLIAQNHHRIVLNQELLTKCHKKLSALRSSGRAFYGGQVLRSFLAMAFDEDFCRQEETGTDPPYDETAIPRKDRFIVRLAFITASILVSTDRKLLNSARAVLHDSNALRPEHAIPYAQEA